MRISPSKIVLINPTISNTAAGRARTGNSVENTPKAPESKFDTVTISGRRAEHCPAAVVLWGGVAYGRNNACRLFTAVS